ncbi:hypothetical protein [Bifidobacterium vansinderenii]|uniref:DNA-binding protein n=1 Tax=Bifidobacterium vansinderenii TaxID=1984871 RepID=A0A229VZS7_9BIFI|nr:hypothetical protein [Bifidobacterium vansinderenii]OXN01076.1 DNA-binding protein [Bifidobacterium vansinderenii]
MGLSDMLGTPKKNVPHTYESNGHEIVCSQCGGRAFIKGEALLNTAGMTFLDLDFLNRSADILVCEECSHVEWFVNHVRQTDL